MNSGSSPVDFDAFWYAQYDSVVGLAFILVGNTTAAEELTQDAFTEAHIRWETVSQYEKPEAWVRRVLVNKSRSRFRKLKTEAKTLTKLQAVPHLNIDLPQRSDEVWDAVRALPKRQAQAIALRYWNELSIEEIAEILDCGPATVKTHLKRGRGALAKQLGSSYNSEEAYDDEISTVSPLMRKSDPRPQHRAPGRRN